MLRQQIITAAPFEAISLEYAKKALKLPSEETVEDELLAVYIAAANELASSHTGIIPIETQLAQYFETWADLIIIYQAAPILTVESIEYMPEGSSTYSTLSASAYVLDKYASPPRIKILEPGDLPAINADQPEAIKITFKAGYLENGEGVTEAQLQAAVPSTYRQAVALMAAHWYLYRADYAKKEAPSAAMSLLNSIKVNWL